MMIMIKVFGCSIEKTVLCVWFVLQICKRRIVVEHPIREDGEFIAPQVPERERNGGIDSCILTFDPLVLFMSFFIRRHNVYYGSYTPVTRLRSLGFLFVVGLNIY